MIAFISSECLVRIYDQIVLMTCLVHLQSLRPACIGGQRQHPRRHSHIFFGRRRLYLMGPELDVEDGSNIIHVNCDGRGWYAANHQTTRDAQPTHTRVRHLDIAKCPLLSMAPLGQRQRKTFRPRHIIGLERCLSLVQLPN
jgi:hypothetical protein